MTRISYVDPDDLDDPELRAASQKALRYTAAVCWDPSSADDAMWEQLHAHFTEPELVELGSFIDHIASGQRWIRSASATARCSRRRPLAPGLWPQSNCATRTPVRRASDDRGHVG
jgi:hypothetical protein